MCHLVDLIHERRRLSDVVAFRPVSVSSVDRSHQVFQRGPVDAGDVAAHQIALSFFLLLPVFRLADFLGFYLLLPQLLLVL